MYTAEVHHVCMYVCILCWFYWFAECYFFYETCGVQCLLSEGLLKTLCGEGASSNHRGFNIQYTYINLYVLTIGSMLFARLG